MSWVEYVSGGVGRSIIAAYDALERCILQLELPPSAALVESYEAIKLRHINLAGKVLDTPRGFRYHARIQIPHMDAATWRMIAALFAAWRAGSRVAFQPHADCAKIVYTVVPSADFCFPYAGGKYLGYAGILELTGAELLTTIPITWEWDHFCAADEVNYNPAEISYFAAVGAEGYSAAEPAYFCPAVNAG